MSDVYPFERGPFPYDLKLWDYYYSLWADRRWVHRRVDNIGASQSSTWSDIKITFDINAAVLEATARSYRISPEERLLLPLMTLPKSHMLGFEAEMNGKVQSLAGNDDSARIAQAISFCSFLKSHPVYQEDFKTCYKKLAEDTYRAFKDSSARSLSAIAGQQIAIARQHSQESKSLAKEAAELISESENFSSPEKLKYLVSRIEKLTKEMLSANTYARLLVNFIQHLNSFWGTTNSPIADHALIVLKSDRVPASSNAMLTLNFLKPHGSKLGKKFVGRSHKVIQYRESLLGSHFENRYHIRIQVPPTLRIVSARRVAEEKNPRIIDNFNLPPNDWILGGQDDRVEIHDRKLAQFPSNGTNCRKHYALIQVEPYPHVFYTKAAYTVSALLAFLIFTDWYSFKPIDIVPASVALAALFVGVPKLLGRATEDSLTESILSRMRQGLSSLVAISLASGIVRQLSDPVVQRILSDISDLQASDHGFSIIGALFTGQSFSIDFWPASFGVVGIFLWLFSCSLCVLYFGWLSTAYSFYRWNSRKASKLFSAKETSL